MEENAEKDKKSERFLVFSLADFLKFTNFALVFSDTPSGNPQKETNKFIFKIQKRR